MTIDTQSFSTRRRVNSLAVDRIDEKDFQIVKLAVGEEDSFNLISEDNPIPVEIVSGGGGGAGGTEFDEDTPHAPGDSGTMVLAVRRDADTTLVDTDGDYAPLQVDADGNLKVNVVIGGGSVGGEIALDAATLAALESTTIVDGGGSITVDGAVAATQSGTWTVTGAGGTFPVTDSGGSLTVDGTVAATQSGTWNVGTVTTVTAVTAISNALPAGNNNIGDVDVASIVPGTGATNLGKAEDAAHTTGDVGVMGLAVRRDADTSLVGADGDYAPLQVNSTGSLKVAITAGAGSGGTSIADGATYTRDSTSVTPIAAVVETSAPTLTNGDASALSMTTGGALRVAVASGGVAGVVEDAAASDGVEGIAVMAVRRDSASSGVSADGDYAMLSVTSDGSLRVSGSAGTTQYTEDAASAGGEALCLVGAVRRDTAASSSGTDGDYSTLNVDSTGRLHVNVGNTVTVGSHAVTNAGTFAVQAAQSGTWNIGSITTLPALVAGTANIGDVDIASIAAGDNNIGNVDVVTLPSIPAGNNNIGDVDVASLPALAAGTNTIGNVINAASATVGGHSAFRSIDCDETEDEVKSSAGKLFWIHAMNMTAAVLYLKVYNNTAAGTTVGTTTPVFTFPLPTLATTNGAGFAIHFGDTGVTFSTGICFAVTTGLADADTGAPAANACFVNAGFL